MGKSKTNVDSERPRVGGRVHIYLVIIDALLVELFGFEVGLTF